MTTLYVPQHIANQTKEFSRFVSELKNYYASLNYNQTNFTRLEKHKINALLNGKASEALRNLVPISVRKKHGIFFTPSKVSKVVAKRLNNENTSNIKIYDPCMGSGDLLLSCAKKIIDREHSFNSILEILNDKIQGVDIHEPFIDFAKLRFILFAAQQSENYRALNNLDIHLNKLTNFKPGNSLKIPVHFYENDIVIVNPPYLQVKSEGKYSWTNGKTQLAAIFIDEIVKNAEAGVQLIAILPDVLRSGSNYEKWRLHILKHGEILKIKILGRFDDFTDVDVFLLHLRINKKRTNHNINFNYSKQNKNRTFNDFFNVGVGTVVPFRNKDSKSKQLYLTCKEANWWDKTTKLSSTKFDGKLFQPPFVAVRRTSNPSEKYRAYSTIVNGDKKIAVENHLIVLSPKNRSLNLCQKLLSQLKNKRTNDWLNKKIRCRHLTVKAIKSIPW